MTCKQWDVILLPFPYTDLSSAKKRPAVIISPLQYNKGLDTVFMYLTSKISKRDEKGSHELLKWKEAGLPLPSMTKMKFMALDKNLIVKKIGEIQDADKTIIKQKLKLFFAL